MADARGRSTRRNVMNAHEIVEVVIVVLRVVVSLLRN